MALKYTLLKDFTNASHLKEHHTKSNACSLYSYTPSIVASCCPHGLPASRRQPFFSSNSLFSSPKYLTRASIRSKCKIETEEIRIDFFGSLQSPCINFDIHHSHGHRSRVLFASPSTAVTSSDEPEYPKPKDSEPGLNNPSASKLVDSEPERTESNQTSTKKSRLSELISTASQVKSGTREPNYEYNTSGVCDVPAVNQITSDPSCPIPDFSSSPKEISLICPLPLMPESSSCSAAVVTEKEGRKVTQIRPLLVYVPGMDCTGQCIRSQIPFLYNDGYDIRCVYIPSNDRTSWEILVTKLSKLIESEALIENKVSNSKNDDMPNDNLESTNRSYRHVTILAESFGACLSLRLALKSPHLISRLIVVNPATNFKENNPLISFCVSTGLLERFPMPLYELAQDFALPLLIKRNKVKNTKKENLISPIDYVTSSCANFRLSLLNDEKGLEEYKLAKIEIPTLLIAGAKDRVIPAVNETSRLKKLIKNSQRLILPESGHTIFLEDGTNISEILKNNNFPPPAKKIIYFDEEDDDDNNYNNDDEKLKLIKHETIDDTLIDEFCSYVEPWRVLVSPLVLGAENLPNPNAFPKRPILFVGNHTIFGIYDTPLLIQQLYLRGFKVKGLAHPAHWLTVSGPIMERYGNVKASPFAAYRLLKEGENVLLFPGGSREVCKKKGEKYKLFWKEKVDFVRMAAKLNSIIVPFSAIGAEDAYDILFDSDDVKNSIFGEPVKKFFDSLGLVLEDNFQPITALPGTNLPSLIPIPSLEKVYFYFSKPIDTKDFSASKMSKHEWEQVYALVKSSVENGIEYLKQEREKDEERSFPNRFISKLSRLLPEFSTR